MEWLCDPLNMDDKNACGYDYFIMKPFNIYLYEASELWNDLYFITYSIYLWL